jgi:transcriptional regulator with XRE-family HTH domain
MRAERERRGWSQADMAKMLSRKGIQSMYPTTVAKIEAGERAVRIDEANAIADLFEVSLDSLLGAHQLSETAVVLRDRFGDLSAFDFDGRDELATRTAAAGDALMGAMSALMNLSAFELPPDAEIRPSDELTQRAAIALIEKLTKESR